MNPKGGGGGRTRANSVCFTKNVVKIGAFPNATPTSKIWKNLSKPAVKHSAVMHAWENELLLRCGKPISSG